MGRGATKAAGNLWYEARINAAKYNDKLSSREGAAELLGCSVDVLVRVENDLYKCMPVETAILMADLYNAPHLLNHYCRNCPIGCDSPISDENPDLDRVTVKLLKKLKLEKIASIKERLLEIAEDGVISEDEKPELEEVVGFLEEIVTTVSELRSITRKVLNGG